MVEYIVTLWDKQINEPHQIHKYQEVEVAKQVARNIKRHYVDEWGTLGEEFYEVRLHKRGSND
jgi:hypothetical protein